MAVPNVIYNINVKSKFELFLNEDLVEAEPDEIVKKMTEDKKKKDMAQKEAKKLKQTDVKKTVTKATVESELPKVDDKVSTEKAPRFKKTETKTPVKPKNVGPRAVTQATKVELGGDEESADDKDKASKAKKNFGNGVKRGRGREFDRHSGSDKTGVKSVERRDGSGSYNWGNVKDMVDLSQEPTIADPKEEVVEDKPVVTAENVEKEQEKAVMTISEWKALHNTENVISSHVPTRPANNGENVFTGMNLYKKKNVQHNESDNEIVVPEDDTDSKGRRQIKLNIEFSGRARRGRGGFNNARFKDDKVAGKDGVINLDEEEFPTLS